MSSSKTIGIIGGGQLGQMMAISAIYMGHKVIALDPAADCPASRVAEIIVAPYNDVDALRQLAERCDVLTYEFENVDADGLMLLLRMDNSLKEQICSAFLKTGFFEKDFLSNKAQVTVAPYKVVTSSQDLARYRPVKKLCSQDGDWWLRWAWSKSHSFSRRFGRSLCISRLSRLRFGRIRQL